MEACAVCGEVPVVFAVVAEAGTVADEVFVLERNLSGCFGAEFVAVVHEVPSKAELQVEVA